MLPQHGAGPVYRTAVLMMAAGITRPAETGTGALTMQAPTRPAPHRDVLTMVRGVKIDSYTRIGILGTRRYVHHLHVDGYRVRNFGTLAEAQEVAADWRSMPYIERRTAASLYPVAPQWVGLLHTRPAIGWPA